MPSKAKNSNAVARDARTGRLAEIGGTTIRVATPVTSLSVKKRAEIRAAVREFYAGKKGA